MVAGAPGRLLARGAEAEVYLVEWGGRPAVLKRRVPKPYRHPLLDRSLRIKRTLTEARMLVRCLELGVSVPVLYEARLSRAEIVMEYVPGVSLRWYLEEHGLDGVAERAARELGRMIGVLHEHGFTHGDVTTSNLIIGEGGSYKLIDLGLAEATRSLEDQAVDVHLYLRAVESTHPEHTEALFNLFLEGYRGVRGGDTTERVLEAVRRIRLMGRYVEERRRRTVWGELRLE